MAGVRMCLLVACALIPSQLQAQSLEDEIRSQVLRFVEIVSRGDPSALADLYVRDSAVATLGDGQINVGWQAITRLFEELYTGVGSIRMTVDSVTVAPLGPDGAVAYFRYFWHFGNESLEPVRGAMTIVYRRTANGWRVLHDHTSTLPGPRTAPGYSPVRPSDAGAPLLGIDSLPSLYTGACGVRCGVERWLVKKLSDPDRDQVVLDPVSTSVAGLAALPRPPSLSPDRRASPVELTTFVVDAYLAGWSGQQDRDYHLILADPDYQRVTMVAEIPDPSCDGACHSGLGQMYAEARAVLETALQTPKPNDAPILLRVTGVGFFDYDHGQIGAAPNVIELHPVLRIEWLR